MPLVEGVIRCRSCYIIIQQMGYYRVGSSVWGMPLTSSSMPGLRPAQQLSPFGMLKQQPLCFCHCLMTPSGEDIRSSLSLQCHSAAEASSCLENQNISPYCPICLSAFLFICSLSLHTSVMCMGRVLPQSESRLDPQLWQKIFWNSLRVSYMLVYSGPCDESTWNLLGPYNAHSPC